MPASELPLPATTNVSGVEVSEISIPELVGRIYESAPLTERRVILEPLLRPLGVLSLLAVANGMFANIRFRSGWPVMRIPLDELQNVTAADVIALVEYAQRGSGEAIAGLARMLSTSPLLGTSVAAGLLVTMIMGRRRTRRSVPSEAIGPSVAAR